VLITEDGVLTDSTDILHALDERAPADARLYPLDAGDRAEVERLEDQFDEVLGPHTRRYAYYYLLDHARTRPLMKLDVRSRVERGLFHVGLPLVKLLMRKLLRIDAEGARRSEARIMETFAEVDALLADGRRTLVGGRFSAADLTFAALAAPVLFPPEYGFPLPDRSELPPELLAKVEELRARPAGRFALRLFREERGRVVAQIAA
jgi:glutathione S-transferase